MEYLEQQHIFKISDIFNLFDTLEAMEDDIGDNVQMVASIILVGEIWHLSIKFTKNIISKV